jgi:hypothetical protein
VRAVSARIDWKYALGLELTDPGFHFSVLTEFCARLIAGDAAHLLLDRMLTRFAEGLRRDREALIGTIKTPRSTSPVEGQISRLKMLKRTMFGRADFALLRQRVLAAG